MSLCETKFQGPDIHRKSLHSKRFCISGSSRKRRFTRNSQKKNGINHLLSLCSHINLNFWGSKRRWLNKVEIDVSAGSNEPSMVLATEIQTGVKAIITRTFKEKKKRITLQVFEQGTGKVSQSYNCSLLKFHSIGDSFSCGK